MTQGQTLVMNDFLVEIVQAELSGPDILGERLSLDAVIPAMNRAKEQGYSFVGLAWIRFEGVGDLATGMFRIRPGVIRRWAGVGGHPGGCCGLPGSVVTCPGHKAGHTA